MTPYLWGFDKLMGHTLIARCPDSSLMKIKNILSKTDIVPNKIPYGRDCDRETANKILPYHMTVFHWAKSEDQRYLPRFRSFRFHPFEIVVTGVQVIPAEEGSRLLYLAVKSGKGYSDFCHELELTMGVHLNSFLHITLAVSKNDQEIEELRKQIVESIRFPFTIPIDRLELYHIWKPVKLMGVWKAEMK